ncbi:MULTISPECIES: hypothetical protein [Aerococcus]|uniref:Uncharacterized protein n=1 Tax=Aerococcus tenax TaxID=3078812 RepID=A0A5N1BC09_9LACT|nr:MULTISPECIES: hypothetical protein [Aerococcus]KAA9237557.1 hypothetical protein F6I34_09495 [Aerococcus urinae]MDK6371636.1 hypothetical protein [Aerococcus urinae]MDK6597061.1 hypothetical protein [Aerococcus urinae]MDK7802027.1 hypothetical protein [Aerococcus urinae]MDK8655614.1 hypothetical protein [Aerococcus urinae]
MLAQVIEASKDYCLVQFEENSIIEINRKKVNNQVFATLLENFSNDAMFEFDPQTKQFIKTTFRNEKFEDYSLDGFEG